MTLKCFLIQRKSRKVFPILKTSPLNCCCPHLKKNALLQDKLVEALHSASEKVTRQTPTTILPCKS